MIYPLPKPSILIAVDAVVIAVSKWSLQVLLVERKDINNRVLPWGFVWDDETLLTATKRKLQQETWYNKFPLHALWFFDDIKRDDRWRIISAAFLSVTNKNSFPFTDWGHVQNAQFFPIGKLPPLLYDHKNIIKAGIKKLQELIMHTDIAKSLVAKRFTLTELQAMYEQILWTKLNVRNFRKKIIDTELVKPTGEVQLWVWHRPAQYYCFS